MRRSEISTPGHGATSPKTPATHDFQPLRVQETTETSYYCWRQSASMPSGHQIWYLEGIADCRFLQVRTSQLDEFGTHLCGSTSRILTLLAGAGIDL
jgi:hypothetical protein